MRQKERVRLVALANRLQRVEVLRHHHQLHHVARRRSVHHLLELLDGDLQSLDDRLALIGDALALQRLALRLGLGLLHHQNLLRLAARVGRHLFALRRVDVVHRRLDLGVGNNVGHQHIHNLEAEGGHVCVQLLLHRRGNRRLRGKDLIQRHTGHMAQNHLLHVRFDLRRGVGQLIKGVVDLLRTHTILHGNRNGHEDVVLGLGLHGQRNLVDPQAHGARDGVEERNLPVQARISDPQKLSKTRYDGNFGSVHGEEAAENDRENENEYDESRGSQKNQIGRVH